MKSWRGHVAMIVALEFVKVGFFVAGKFHHAPEIGILLVTAVKLHFPVAGDYHEQGSVRSHVI